MNQIFARHCRHKGTTAVLAMVFLMLFSTLTVAMYSLAVTNTQSAVNLTDVDRARAQAESGLRWIEYRLKQMPRPKTTIGNITSSVAFNLWPEIQDAIESDFGNLLNESERPVTLTETSLVSSQIATDDGPGHFVITVQQHPLYVGDPLDSRYLRVTSTGTYKEASRSLHMDFKIDKKVKFAVVGKTRIQLGTIDWQVNGAVELSQRLAESPQVQSCAARKWFEYAQGRAIDPADECRVRTLQGALQAAGGDIRELLVALVKTPEFIYRPVIQ